MAKRTKAVFTVDGQEVPLRAVGKLTKAGLATDYMAQAEAVRNLRISAKVLTAARDRGELGALKVGARWYYRRQDLAALIQRL